MGQKRSAASTARLRRLLSSIDMVNHDANAKEDSRSNPRGIQLAGNRKSSGTRQRCGISLFIFSGKSI